MCEDSAECGWEGVTDQRKLAIIFTGGKKVIGGKQRLKSFSKVRKCFEEK